MSRRVILAAGAALMAVTFAVVAYAATTVGPAMGPASKVSQLSWQGYYDGHKDTYLNTDVSSKADAKAMHINYSASIGRVKHLPEIYLVQGRAAPNQLAVFGSEPGEPSYSPLWSETILNWKPGATPVVIKSDTQVNALEKKGVLTEHEGHKVLNCPIIRVGR
jgi:hypothetical protein